MALTDQQRAFVRYYCGVSRFNATDAARRADYSDPNAQAYRLKQNPEVKGAIKAHLDELAMSAEEVLHALREHAMASVEDFLTVNGTVKVDVKKAKRAAKLHQIKSVTIEPKPFGDKIKIEMYDAQAALVQLGRHHALFTDKVEHDFSKLSDAELIDRARGLVAGGSGDPGGDGAAGADLTGQPTAKPGSSQG